MKMIIMIILNVPMMMTMMMMSMRNRRHCWVHCEHLCIFWHTRTPCEWVLLSPLAGLNPC